MLTPKFSFLRGQNPLVLPSIFTAAWKSEDPVQTHPFLTQAQLPC